MGNENSTFVAFAVDITSPSSSTNYTANGTTVGENQTLKLTESDNMDADPDTVYCTDSSGACTPYIPIDNGETIDISSEGATYVRFSSKDDAANSQMLEEVVRIDRESPVVSLIGPPNSSTWTSSDTVTFAYNVSDANNIVNCSLLIDGEVDQTITAVVKNAEQTFMKTLSNGDCNWSILCTDESGKIGSSEVFALKVSYTPPEPSEKRRSGGGGGYAPPEPQPYVSYSWSEILPGKTVNMELNREEIAIREIKLMVNNSVRSASMKVIRLEDKPDDVSSAGEYTYQYLEIQHSKLEGNMERAFIAFCVDNDWISDNNIDKYGIALSRYSSGWEGLPTQLTSEDDEKACFESETEAFSYFAITGSRIRSIPVSLCGNGLCDSGETCLTCPDDCGACPEEGKETELTEETDESESLGITGLITSFVLSYLIPLFIILSLGLVGAVLYFSKK